MANVSLSCRMVGFSACRSFLLYLLFFFFSLYLILFLGVYSSRRTLVIISRKISFPHPRPRREIPPCTSIAGERGWQAWRWRDVGNCERRRGGNKSVQRGRKRNCFVSESTVCVLAWLTPLPPPLRSPLPPFLLLDRHTVSPSLALRLSLGWGKKYEPFFGNPSSSFRLGVCTSCGIKPEVRSKWNRVP